MSPEVLVAVNAARKVLGLRPLKGMPAGRQKDACYCPLANALGGAGEVFSFGFRLYEGLGLDATPEQLAHEIASAWGTYRLGREATLPQSLRQFVSDFDKGKYRHLEEPKENQVA